MLLLSALSYSGLAVLSLSAEPPSYPLPSYLVVIIYDDWDDLQWLASLGLSLLDWQNDRLAAIVTSQELAALRSKDFDVRVLDAPGVPEPSYYLVTPPPSGEITPLYRRGLVFPYAEGAFILKADPSDAELLPAQGFFIQRLLGAVVLPTSPSPDDVDVPRVVIQEHDPLIQGMVDSISQTQIYTTILKLQDDDAIPGWDAERSRFSYAPELAVERDYIRSRMESLGLDVRYQNFSLGGMVLDNVEGTLGGWGLGNDLVYIVCAHYDSTSELPYDAAPGADDNASGTAAVLEAARVLSQYRYRRTLRFVTFSAEEQGLIGSYYYALEAHSAGTSIGGAINLDMIGWDLNQDNVMEVHAGIRGDSQALGAAFLGANLGYGIGLVPQYNTLGASIRSDHASFWRWGYPAILLIEDTQYFNPYYHRTDDTLDKLDLPYATKFVRATVATVAELAEIMPPGVSVEQAGPGMMPAGTLALLRVQYANPGPVLATGVVITGTLSPGLAYVEDSSGLPLTRPVSDTVVWQVGEVPSYTLGSFVVTTSVEANVPAGTQLSSSVEITGATTWDDPGDNRATWTGLVSFIRHLPLVFKEGQ